MNIPDYLIHHYTKTKSSDINNYIIVGEGGSGKTTGIMELYRRLLKNLTLTKDEKNLVPIYISASRLERRDNDVIQKYIIENYLPAKPGADQKILCSTLERDIFNSSGSKMQYVILIDALNENFNYLIMTEEIRRLSEMFNVNVVVTVRSEKNLLLLDDFKILRMSRLDPAIVADCIAMNGGIKDNEKLSRLLEIPFYLSKYVELFQKNHTDKVTSITTAYDLLESYYATIKKELLQNTQLVPLEQNDRFDAGTIRSLEAEKCFDKVAPSIAFSIARKKQTSSVDDTLSTSMIFTLSDTNVLEDIRKNLKRCDGSKTNMALIDDLEDTIRLYLEPMGILVSDRSQTSRTASAFAFPHEFIRDYLVVRYINQAIVNNRPITPKDYQLFPSEIMDMLAGAMIHDTSFIVWSEEKGYAFNYGGFAVGETTDGIEKLMKVFHLMASDNLSIPLENFSWFTYNLLQNIPNKENQKKKQFSKSYSEMTEIVVSRITVENIQSNKIKLSNSILELLRMHGEMLRRSGQYDLCVNASKKMKEICEIALKYKLILENETLEEQLGEAKNNEYKNEIEKIYDLIKRNKLREEDKEELFDYLKKLHDNKNTSSANLIAALVYQPDPIMKPFIEEYRSRNNISDEVMYSFNKYRNSVRFEYKHRPDDPGLRSYALIKCISFFLDDQISVNADEKNVRYWCVDNFVQITTKFERFKQQNATATYTFAIRLIEELENTETSGALNVLRLKYLLRTHSNNIEEFLQYSSINNYPFTIFVRSVLQDDLSGIVSVKDELLKSKDEKRKYDAYDVVYVLEDIRFAWKSLKQIKTPNKDVESAVENILQLDLNWKR